MTRPLNLTVMYCFVDDEPRLKPVSEHAESLASLMRVSAFTAAELAFARKHLGANVVIKVPPAPDLDSLLGSTT